MKNIMNMSGSIVNDNRVIKGLGEYVYEKYIIHTYEWTCGDTEYDLVYDNDGELYGIITDGIHQDVLNDIVEKPYNYDFPPTLDDYMEEYSENYDILWSIEANNEISPCKLDNRQEKLSTEYRSRLFDKNICSFIVEAPLNKWIPVPTRFYRDPVNKKSFTFYIKIMEV